MSGDPLPKIQVLEGSLTDGDALVLVNASNTHVDLGSGVSAAIRNACGPEFQHDIHAARDKVYGGPMSPGDVLLTHAGRHPRARYVAHAAVMDYRQGFGASAFPDGARIERCLENLWTALESIPEPKVSVALPALGAGTGRLGVRLPTEIASTTLAAHCKKVPSTRIERVLFYGFLREEFQAIRDVLQAHFRSLIG